MDEDFAKVAWKLKEDATIFSNFFFNDPYDPDEKFVPYAWQDAVFNDGGDRIVICTSRQIGKSTAAALMAIQEAYFNTNSDVVVISKTKDQSIEFIKRITDFMKNSNVTAWDPLKAKDQESVRIVRIKNKQVKGKPETFSRIISVPATDAARGYSPRLVIADELAFWENPEYVFRQVVLPMVKHSKGRVIAISTPNGQQGIFYDIFNSEHWNSYQFDWRACPDFTEEDMEKEKADTPALEFSSEYEAEFISPKNSYFTMGEIERASKGFEYKPNSSVTALAIDIGKHHDNAVIMVGCLDDPMADRKDSVIRVTDIREKPLGTKYASLIGEIKDLHAKHKFSVIMVDATGSGEGPGEFLQLEGLPVELVKFSIVKKALIYSTMKVLMEDKGGRFKMPPEKRLLNELGWMMYEYTSIGNIKIFPPEGQHDDYADASALLCYGLTNFMSAPASMVIVPKIPQVLPEIKVHHDLVYCAVHDDYHWGKCDSL